MKNDLYKNIGRVVLGNFLTLAGISHLTFAKKEFKAQVPNWVPISKNATVVYSGIAEIILGRFLVVAPKKLHPAAGMAAATFFAAVFPGNIAQYKNHKSAFGLNTDSKRLARLFFQPLLICWALASCCGKDK